MTPCDSPSHRHKPLVRPGTVLYFSSDLVPENCWESHEKILSQPSWRPLRSRPTPWGKSTTGPSSSSMTRLTLMRRWRAGPTGGTPAAAHNPSTSRGGRSRADAVEGDHPIADSRRRTAVGAEIAGGVCLDEAAGGRTSGKVAGNVAAAAARGGPAGPLRKLAAPR